MNIIICIPTFNEAENIETLLNSLLKIKDRLLKHKISILVIDDNSPDKTAQIAYDLASKSNSDIAILNNSEKKGLGLAYIQGFNYALSQNADAVLMMDADLSHSSEDVVKLLEKIDEYDFVVGSRYIAGGEIKNWSVSRKMISKFGNFYAKAILRSSINDLTGGFNIYKTKVLREINLSKIKSTGYSFQIEVKYKSQKRNFSSIEVPITFKDRLNGASKFNWKIIFEAIFTPWKLVFEKGE